MEPSIVSGYRNRFSLYNSLESMYHDCRLLSEIGPLQYDSLQRNLHKADRLFEIVGEEVDKLVEAGSVSGTEHPETQKQLDTVTKRAKGLSFILQKMGSEFQTRLDKKCFGYGALELGYDALMDRIYDDFYRQMASTILENLAESEKPIGTSDPIAFAKSFAAAVVPRDGYRALQGIMDKYNRTASEASELYEQVKDTFLNTMPFWSMLMKHSLISAGPIKGKRAKVKTDLLCIQVIDSELATAIPKRS